MANVSRIKGFRPIKHTSGAPYNGQFNIYQHSASDGVALFVGDCVKIGGNASAGGIATVAAATAGAAVLGVIVGVIPVKLDPIAGTLSTGSTTLDAPQYVAASVAQYVMVCDADDVLYEVEGTTSGGASYTYASTDVGGNADAYVGGSGSTTTGNSAQSLNLTGINTTATLQFKVLGAIQRPDNETVDGTSTAVKYLVKINNATLGGGTGATGT